MGTCIAGELINTDLVIGNLHTAYGEWGLELAEAEQWRLRTARDKLKSKHSNEIDGDRFGMQPRI